MTNDDQPRNVTATIKKGNDQPRNVTATIKKGNDQPRNATATIKRKRSTTKCNGNDQKETISHEM